MKKTTAILGTAALIVAMSTGCIGQMALSGKVRQFNLELVEGKWLREAVFLALYIIPVYPIAAGIDLVIVNSLEFHTGTNPMTGKPRIARAGETRRVETEDGVVIASTLREDGSIDFEITDADGDRRFVNLARRGDGAVARDGDGRALAWVGADGAMVTASGSAR